MKQHKWHKEIKAFADGETIQSREYKGDYWQDDDRPFFWREDFQFRIKPQNTCEKCCCQTCSDPKEPQYLYFFKDNVGNTFARTSTAKNSCDTYIGKIKLEE
jgi:hypothetical protein